MRTFCISARRRMFLSCMSLSYTLPLANRTSYLLLAILQHFLHLSKLLLNSLGSLLLGRGFGGVRLGGGIFIEERAGGVEGADQGGRVHAGEHSGRETGVQTANRNGSKTELRQNEFVSNAKAFLPTISKYRLEVCLLFHFPCSFPVSPFVPLTFFYVKVVCI